MCSMQDIGVAIKRERKSKGINQEILAEKAEINRSYLSQIENNKRRISLDVAMRIAKALKIPLQELINNWRKS